MRQRSSETIRFAPEAGAGALEPRFRAAKGMIPLSVCLLLSVFVSVGVSRAGAAECGNESLRAESGSLELPNCRAYERVTPANKNGAEFYSPQRIWVGGGPRLAAETFANFGGAEFGYLLGTAYEFTRSESEWRTTPLVPSSTLFGGSNFESPLFALGEGGRTLLGLRRPGTPQDSESLYLRQGSAITEVGPEAPPSSWHEPVVTEHGDNTFSYFFGERFATPDLSHVLYQLFTPEEHRYFWPFDQTSAGGALTTYEYVGTDNAEPFLVGVVGGQGSTELISGCGTYVGSAFDGDVYNAMARDGRTVYFTPIGEDRVSCSSPAGEPSYTGVYARVEGEGSAARTVSISEPDHGDCTECQTTLPQYAAFQGASEDGSKAFFLTEQELLPDNPGKNIYEYDFDGPSGDKVKAISHRDGGGEAGVRGVVRISENGSHVYFVASEVLTSTANSVGASAEPGKPNLYVYNSGAASTAFVGTLDESDSALWNERDEGRPAEATPDGRYLLFASTSRLTPDDTSTVSQLFRYDAATGELIRISTGQNGFGENGNTSTDPVTIPPQFVHFAGYQSGPLQRMISDDGSRIFFESTGALTPKAFDHVRLPGEGGFYAENVYEWQSGQVSLIAGGRDRTHIGIQNVPEQRSSVLLLGTDPGGEDVFFTTTTPLVPEDIDAVQDIYDARVDGGFRPPMSTSCGGESCQGPASSPPSEPVVGSSNSTSPDPVFPKKPHKKKPHKKKKHKAKQQHHRNKQRSRSDGHADEGDHR